MKKKKRQEQVSHERWLVSYADFITLMFAFFVVMFASSQVNKRQVARIAASFNSFIRDGKALQEGFELEGRKAAEKLGRAGKGDGLEELAELHKAAQGMTAGELAPVKAQLEQDLVEEIEQGKISLSIQARGLVVSLRESALFPPGRDTFTPGAMATLTRMARALVKLSGQPLRLEGHTDNVPIETLQFPSNWELSTARAVAVLELLTGKFHMDPQTMAVAGYADHHAVASNDTPDGRARNRRVDVVVLSRSAAEMEPRQRREPEALPSN